MERAYQKKRWLTGLGLALFLLLAGVAAIPARMFVGDPYTWREEAINLLLFHRLNVEPEVVKQHGEENQYFVKNPRTGLYYSKYGVMNGLLNVIPLYAEMRITRRIPPWDSHYRRLFLGFFYALVGALFGCLLYRLCLYYTESAVSAALFVCLAIFTTFLGHYLRSSNSEAFQVLFFTVFFERFVAARTAGFRAYGAIWAGWFFLLCLCLVKVSYVLLVPAAAGLLLAGGIRTRELRGIRAVRFAGAAVVAPALLLLLAQGAINYHKFGSPFATGYWWKKDDFSHSIPPWQVFRNLFLTEQWGIPAHFPLLLFALPQFPRFFRRFPFDALLGASCFLLVVATVGTMPMWRGEWSYGPRYFLFALPVLTLPLLFWLDRLLHFRDWRFYRVALPGGAALVVLGFSAWLQLQVERLDPFFAYWVRPLRLEDAKSQELIQFWNSAHHARIAAEAWQKRREPEAISWVREARKVLTPKEYEEYLAQVRTWIRRTNFYWWSPRD